MNIITAILRKLKPFKGKQRLSRFLLRGSIATTKDIMVDARYGCRFKLPNIIENVGFDIYVDGMFEGDNIDYIIKTLPQNAVMVDIGANIGSIALPVANSRKDVKVLCIEASPRVFKYLTTNASLNNATNCVLFNNAMTDIDGKIVDFFSPEEKFGKGSLSSVFTKNAESIATITLDTLLAKNEIQKVHFIKADIEGYEYHAFKGAAKLLSTDTAPDILFEFVDWAEDAAHGTKPGDAQQLCLDYGYRLYFYDAYKPMKPLLTVLKKGNAMIYATKSKYT